MFIKSSKQSNMDFFILFTKNKNITESVASYFFLSFHFFFLYKLKKICVFLNELLKFLQRRV